MNSILLGDAAFGDLGFFIEGIPVVVFCNFWDGTLLRNGAVHLFSGKRLESC